eukprot:TRINITY_DN1711_c0_g1_i1.p1 TRINITY_DN1711_c0_g1~~TRINITY_DN1711_c0_g1_i1.p1  ORF type:complete len:235 (-),score=32.34 TRINITY_DN1711_c0_g1_i1:17-721(-)
MVTPYRQVLSDVDETLTFGQNGSVLIPGAVQFLHELRGDMDLPDARDKAPLVILLSARFVGKAPVISKLVVDERSIYGETLGGSLWDQQFWRVMAADWRPERCKSLACRKVANLRAFANRPNASSTGRTPRVFVGDNGEGDAHAGKLMLEEGLVEHVFLRRATPTPPLPAEHPRMHCFKSYTEAAQRARDLGLLTTAALHRVVSKCHEAVSPSTDGGEQQSNGEGEVPPIVRLR